MQISQQQLLQNDQDGLQEKYIDSYIGKQKNQYCSIHGYTGHLSEFF